MQDKEKSPPAEARGLSRNLRSERRFFRRLFRTGCCSGAFRFGAIQPTHGICAHAPEDGELCRLRFLGLAVLALVLRADELSVNKDMVALVERVREGFAEAVEGHDAVPLGFRLPLVVRVLPRLLRSDGQHGEIRAVAADCRGSR